MSGVLNDLKVEAWENRGERTNPPQITDAQLRDHVREEFLRDSRLDAAHIEIAASSGHVTLSGSVPFHDMQIAAGDDARNVVGVAWVTNNMMVNPSRRSDEAITKDVRMDFDMDSLLRGQGLVIACRDGVVSLSGTVTNAYERGHAELVAGRPMGVKRVIDDLVLPSTNVPSDASIVQRIKDRLRWNWATHAVADRLHVAVEKGVVSLSGECDTWYQREQAMDSALGAEGVLRGYDQIRVTGFAYPWNEWDEWYWVPFAPYYAPLHWHG